MSGQTAIWSWDLITYENILWLCVGIVFVWNLISIFIKRLNRIRNTETETIKHKLFQISEICVKEEKKDITSEIAMERIRKVLKEDTGIEYFTND